MAYIEENMRLRRGEKEDSPTEQGPADPYAELFRLTGKGGVPKKEEEGSVTNSLAMLTAIPEVDLVMECVRSCLSSFLGANSRRSPSTRLKNIEETEKAKRQMTEQRRDRAGKGDDEAHLSAARCTFVFGLPFAMSPHLSCSLPTKP